MNVLIDKNNNLKEIDYTFILKEILKNIKSVKVHSGTKYILVNELSSISKNIAQNILQNDDLEKRLNLNCPENEIISSVNFKDEKEFRKNIKLIDESLEEILKETDFSHFLINNLKDYQKQNIKRTVNFGLDFDFKNQSLQKNKMNLCFDKNTKHKKRLRVEEVNINIKISEIKENIKKSIINTIKKSCDLDEDVMENLIDEVNSESEDIKLLFDLLDSEALARVKRSIGYIYLEYVFENFETKKEENNIKQENLVKDYIRRFKLFDEFLVELSKKSINDCLINEIDICDLFSRENAFDELPIIGVVDGNIFEDSDENFKNCKFTMKLKLNGKVSKYNYDSAYDYYIDCMKNRVEQKKDEISTKKRFKIFFLYNFFIRNLGQLDYNPCKNFYMLKENLEKDFDNNFEKFINMLEIKLNQDNTKQNLKQIENYFKQSIKQKTYKSNKKELTLDLILHQNILDKAEFENYKIIKDCVDRKYGTKPYLRYVSVTENKKYEDSLFSTNINVVFETFSTVEQNKIENLTFDYDLKNTKTVSVVFYPYLENEDMKNEFKEIKNQTLSGKACFYIDSTRDEEFFSDKKMFFVYSFVYNLISYMITKKVLEKLNLDSKTYVSIIRHHNKLTKEKTSKSHELIRSLSKTLSHLLSKDYKVSSQGFDVFSNNYKVYNYFNKQTKNNKQEEIERLVYFKYKNAQKSLYSKVTKNFIIKDIKNIDLKNEKIAMIALSSSKSDFDKETGISTLFGDVVTFDLNSFESNLHLRCENLSSFTENYDKKDLYEKPTILRDIIHKLYKMDYKKIIYISKAPFTTDLNITKKQQVYFMNEKLINFIKGNLKDLIIYPLYYDTFYLYDYENNEKTMYIDDYYELEKLNEGISKSSANIFNLYSGKTVVNNKENYQDDFCYNQMIFYKTLFNIYESKILNTNISEGLILNSTNKKIITNCITCYHYSKYEANLNLNIKINPYENLIGESGISNTSVYEYEISKYKKLKFNSLSFLKEVEKSMEV